MSGITLAETTTIGKGVPDDFMDVAAEGEDSGDDVELQPPYLVARPDVFPPPAVEARVLYVTPQLHSPYAIGARPRGEGGGDKGTRRRTASDSAPRADPPPTRLPSAPRTGRGLGA